MRPITTLCLLILLFISMTLELQAQVTTVQTFNFKSTTRDTMIAFPTKDHNSYEKILMHYGMRCKNALVSTGTDRNKGCGEWDYSCNTYVVDSTRVDSLKQDGPDYVVNGYSATPYSYGDTYAYTTTPTYTFYQSTHREISASGTADYTNVVPPSAVISTPLGQSEKGLNCTYILTAEDLAAVNVNAGIISGLQFPATDGQIELKGLRIYMASTNADNVNQELPYEWQEVYFLDRTLSSSDPSIVFAEDFEWDGNSNIAVNLSYESASGIDLAMMGTDKGYQAIKYTSQAYENYIDYSSSGYLAVESGLDMISDEITISFWQKGEDILPRNTSLLEAKDDNNKRQINIHHPWSNSQIYWDCGNDGNGYDRINKLANYEDYKNQWNHWAFTKDANTGLMVIYLNGKEWHTGTGMRKLINANAMHIGSSIVGNNRLPSYSQMSELRIWNKALDEATISEWMQKSLTPDHPYYDALQFYYTMDKVGDTTVEDLSGKDNHAAVMGVVGSKPWNISETVMNVSTSTILPAQLINQGSYNRTITEITQLDSIANLPRQLDFYILNGNSRDLENTIYVYDAGDFPIYNEEGTVEGERNYPPENEVIINKLDYYSYAPMTFEIMSFVTPYGIGLDLGEEGESWTFDVTDYGPILRGSKRLFMSRGGQNQEEMDIWFEFIEGEPAREVIDITQVWPVTSTGHAVIATDKRFEPRLLTNDPEAAETILKTVITGHGQQGEFEGRDHIMTITNPDLTYSDRWRVWKECADNPIYPQGGTWIYDRAGWCPGMASDVREFRITDFVKNLEDPYLDYSIPLVSGTSNYIVNAQLVTYGPMQRTLDLALEDVVYPTTKVEHRRSNPSCQAPTIILKNYGTETIKKATITYGVVGRKEYTYNYSGNVLPLRSKEAELPFIAELSDIQEGEMFFATIETINESTDEYAANNTYISKITPVDHYDTDIVIDFKTNLRGLETVYRVYDDQGNKIGGRTGGLDANKVYRDTLRGLNGCYQIVIEDSDDDGLSFWANSDGSGYFRMRNVNGSTFVIEPDFGKYSEYNFTAGFVSSTAEQRVKPDFWLYPNPSTQEVYFSDLEAWGPTLQLSLTDQIGRIIYTQELSKHALHDGIPAVNILPNGVYYVTLSDGIKVATRKLVRI